MAEFILQNNTQLQCNKTVIVDIKDYLFCTALHSVVADQVFSYMIDCNLSSPLFRVHQTPLLYNLVVFIVVKWHLQERQKAVCTCIFYLTKTNIFDY